MDNGQLISKEHGSKQRNVYCSVPGVKFRDYEPHVDIDLIRAICITYWKEVNNRDISGTVTREINGTSVTLYEIDAKIVHFSENGTKIRMAFHNGDVIGFMLYHIAYNCVLAIEGMYVLEQHRKQNIGSGFITSLDKPIKKLFFQTHISIRPQEMFKALEILTVTPQELMIEGDLVTWECNWKDKKCQVK